MAERAPAILFECRTCGHVMQVPGRYAGTGQRCRRCGAAFLVPGAPEEPATEAEGVVPAPAARGRRRRHMIVVAALVALAGAGVALVRVSSSPPQATDLVRATLARDVMPVKWAEAPLGEGTAVMLNDVAVYWVHDGVVYACDANARAWSPSAVPPPPGVDLLAVQRALIARPSRERPAVR